MSEIKRDSSGRFVKGTSPGAGPGRPKRQTEADYLAMLTAELTPERWQAIIRRAIADAIKGNGYARAWLADYAIGKPPQTLNINAADAKQLAQLIDLLKETGQTPSEVFERMIQRLEEARVNDAA